MERNEGQEKEKSVPRVSQVEFTERKHHVLQWEIRHNLLFVASQAAERNRLFFTVLCFLIKKQKGALKTTQLSTAFSKETDQQHCLATRESVVWGNSLRISYCSMGHPCTGRPESQRGLLCFLKGRTEFSFLSFHIVQILQNCISYQGLELREILRCYFFIHGAYNSLLLHIRSAVLSFLRN